MSRSALVENVIAMLEDAGFLVSDRCAIRPKSFDVAARRGRDTVLVKILGNIDAFDGRTGAEMRRLGEYLRATPIVIGLRTRDEDLKPGVVYFRHGVPVLSPDTAMDLFVEEVPPLIYAAPGGLYVNIDSKILEDVRQEREWSLGKLAKELGVSRRTVSKYEDGMDASVDVAAKLEELFDAPLTSPVEVLDGADEIRDDEPTPDDPEVNPEDEPIVTVLTRVGFDVHPTERAPFKTVSENEQRRQQMLTGHSEFTETAEKRARIMSSVGEVTGTTSVYVVERATREAVEGTALIEESEMEAIDDADELRDLIRERADGSAD
ncbi:transcriptional regulator [Halapricum desulfuricans]|uniref:Putative HTH-type transcriptional regulatory protein HSEST_1615 n=1 Tax=Halapricum desulfuricans TaxID=2841257 RepID=A0A897NQT6_9EURY|nr:transcriptional regulator [Halapricum desulfuricans]QSG15142.1 putative transcriptional regulator [Halapricum desulfuricans]